MKKPNPVELRENYDEGVVVALMWVKEERAVVSICSNFQLSSLLSEEIEGAVTEVTFKLMR
jgi:hypothetical protein